MKKIVFKCELDVTEKEAQQLIDGPKIKREVWFESLPADVEYLLYRLMEAQRNRHKLSSTPLAK